MNYEKTSNKLKILTIGDIHGNPIWQLPIFGEVGKFEEWEKMGGKFPYQEYTHIIFIGDYVDSFHRMDIEILLNLENIIKFARKSEVPVILLWGNHDVYYIRKEGSVRAGYRQRMQHSLEKLFLDNSDLFKIAYQIDHIHDDLERKFLWTHGGISEEYYENDLKRLLAILKDYEFCLADNLQALFDDRHPVIFQEGYASGGTYEYGSVLWARTETTDAIIEDGYNQIIGHTNFPCITGFFNSNLTSSTFFIDCLNSNSYTSQFLIVDTSTAEIFNVLEYDHVKKCWTNFST